jgi:hypothetical protein
MENESAAEPIDAGLFGRGKPLPGSARPSSVLVQVQPVLAKPILFFFGGSVLISGEIQTDKSDWSYLSSVVTRWFNESN